MPDANLGKRSLQRLKITDLVDVKILQQLQDWFSTFTHISVTMRDPRGKPVTTPSLRSDFCRRVMSTPQGQELCRASNQRACARAKDEREPVKYVCHAGLTQFAAPILIRGRRLGTIVMGDRPEGRVRVRPIRRLAREIGVDADALVKDARAIPVWSDKEMSRGVRFLQAVANLVADLCYKGYDLRHRLLGLSALFEVSRLLASTLDLQKILDILAKNAAESLGFKGCSIRLLDPSGKELVIKSFYNLSKRYLDKGPLLVKQSAIYREAMSGRSVQIHDMLSDRRVVYPEDAKREGIRSGLVLGLLSKGKPVGTLHVYSSESHCYTREEISLLRTLANQAAVAIENATLYQRGLEKQQLDRELAVAGQIQRRLLPARAPEHELVEIAGRSVPCHQVGGDFYDFVPLAKGQLGIAIADVSGKGVPGALLMATTRAALRAQVLGGRRPHRVVQRLNTILCEDTGASQFVTLFYGIVRGSTRSFTYSNAGHNPPLLFRKGRAKRLERGGMVLGAASEESYESGHVSLRPDDVIVLYTDGVTEATSPSGELFGVARLEQSVQARLSGSAEEILAAICRETHSFANGLLRDDLTAVVLKAR